MAKLNIKNLEKILKALANQRRLAILKVLKGNKELSVAEIADEINLSFKSTSRHLNILTTVDIIEKEQRSLNVFYSLSPDQELPVRSIISFI